MKHEVFRAYISLARGEHFTESELGDAREFFADDGEFINSLVLSQMNWTESAELKALICKNWQWSETKFDERLIIEKPTFIQNLYFCSVLRKLFGVERLRFVEGFDRDGIFRLPKDRGFLVPQIRDKRIESLRFYNYGVLRKKAA